MRTKELFLRCLIMLIAAGLVTSYAKADASIRVHMIDARSGLPLANKPVRLWTHDAADQRGEAGFVEERTDTHGVATFSLTDPVPSYLYIHIGMGAPWEECFPEAQAGFITAEISGSGVSEESACWNFPNIERKFHPSPGDVYIFAVHDSLVERVKALGH